MKEKNVRGYQAVVILAVMALCGANAISQAVTPVGPQVTDETQSSSSSSSQEPASSTATAQELGLSFVDGSVSQVIVERNGKKYVVDLASKQVREVSASSEAAAPA